MGKVHQKRAQARSQRSPAQQCRGRSSAARAAKGAETKRLKRNQRDISRAEKVGLIQRGDQGWVPVASLFSDPRYQRDVDKRVVDRMAREFDPDALGVIYVSDRGNGTFAVLDGGHRVAMMRQLGWDDQQMPAFIYIGLSVEEEAHIFHEMNSKRRLPKRIDLFRAEVTAGDDQALMLNKILTNHSVLANAAPGSHNLRAIATVQKALKLAGEDVIDQGIGVAIAAWEQHDDALNGDVLNGIFLLIFANPDIDAKHLAKALANWTPGLTLNKAKAIKEAMPHLTPPAAMAMVLTNEYNKRKRTGRLPSPFYTGWPRVAASGALFGNGWSETPDADDGGED